MSLQWADRLTRVVLVAVLVETILVCLVLGIVIHRTAVATNRLGAENRILTIRNIRVLCVLAQEVHIYTPRVQQICGQEGR